MVQGSRVTTRVQPVSRHSPTARGRLADGQHLGVRGRVAGRLALVVARGRRTVPSGPSTTAPTGTSPVRRGEGRLVQGEPHRRRPGVAYRIRGGAVGRPGTAGMTRGGSGRAGTGAVRVRSGQRTASRTSPQPRASAISLSASPGRAPSSLRASSSWLADAEVDQQRRRRPTGPVGIAAEVVRRRPPSSALVAVLRAVQVERVEVVELVVRIAAEQFVGEQDLPVRAAGGGGGVRDVDARILLAVHPDDAEPGVLLLDEDEHRLLVRRGLAGQVGQIGEGFHIVKLGVARFPPVLGAREQCGEVHRDSPTGLRLSGRDGAGIRLRPPTRHRGRNQGSARALPHCVVPGCHVFRVFGRSDPSGRCSGRVRRGAYGAFGTYRRLPAEGAHPHLLAHPGRPWRAGAAPGRAAPWPR